MRSDMLACDDARPGRHTHHVVVVGTFVVDAFCCERIDAGCSRNPSAITAKGIKPHLIRRYQQYIAFFISHRLHIDASLKRAFWYVVD